jgi:phospholipid/cholesterol/gamma-HCH transport system substrate-binding protein
MQNNNTVETLIGAIVILVAAGFLFFAYTTTSAGSLSGYPLEARFASADGITTGTDVRLHGIKIGTVSGVDLDPKTYMAVVRLSIRKNVPIPDDSAIKVTSSSLLGSSYLSVQPGGSPSNLKPGSQIANTQGSVDIMGLIGRAIYGNTGSNSGAGANSNQPKPPPPQQGSPGQP